MKKENGAKRKMGEVEKVDYRVQSWLQEATMVLDYCTRLAIVNRTGDADGAFGGNPNYMMEYDSEDKEISEAKIKKYVANIVRHRRGWYRRSS